MSADVPDVPVEILPFLMQRPELSVLRPKAAKPLAQPSPQPVHYRCDMCLFETSVHQHYQNHMMEHKSQKDYPRSICNRPYKSEYKLQVHMQSHEQSTNVLPNVCIYCEKRFKTPTLLNNHMKTHFPETFACPYCNKSLCSKANLKKHINSVHSNENYQK